VPHWPDGIGVDPRSPYLVRRWQTFGMAANEKLVEQATEAMGAAEVTAIPSARTVLGGSAAALSSG